MCRPTATVGDCCLYPDDPEGVFVYPIVVGHPIYTETCCPVSCVGSCCANAGVCCSGSCFTSDCGCPVTRIGDAFVSPISGPGCCISGKPTKLCN